MTEAVVVSNGESPGAFSVANRGGDISLSRSVLVERSVAGEWAAAEANIRLIVSCNDLSTESPLVLQRGETFTALPWNGWSCGGQCPEPCRANIYLGPGNFRFVVHSADETRRFEGPPFSLGAESPPR
jgi:hypothetical protein